MSILVFAFLLQTTTAKAAPQSADVALELAIGKDKICDTSLRISLGKFLKVCDSEMNDKVYQVDLKITDEKKTLTYETQIFEINGKNKKLIATPRVAGNYFKKSEIIVKSEKPNSDYQLSINSEPTSDEELTLD